MSEIKQNKNLNSRVKEYREQLIQYRTTVEGEDAPAISMIKWSIIIIYLWFMDNKLRESWFLELPHSPALDTTLDVIFMLNRLLLLWELILSLYLSFSILCLAVWFDSSSSSIPIEVAYWYCSNLSMHLESAFTLFLRWREVSI